MNKNIITFLVIICLMFTPLVAQKQRNIVKVGCVDIQKIVDKVVADRTLRTVLENKNSDFLKKAEKWAAEIKKQQLILENEQGSLPQERLEAIREEIVAKKAQLREYLDHKSQVIQQEEQLVSYGVLKEIYEIVKKVAVNAGYGLVLEKGASVVYSDTELDITNEVLKFLEEEKLRFSN